MPIQNKTMLITYSDSLGNNLKDLYENLEKHFGDAVGGVHLLPFFPIYRRPRLCACGLRSSGSSLWGLGRCQTAGRQVLPHV